ncbi:MAG: SDR family NAD(P)-dependent oxidoreductase [Alphaproteobacteria bacterium]|nr:SDR family NAD(P)-dependent oxidoreductase [Alphaproteobacteria bacterium]
MSIRFDGRVAIVTGAGNGLGRSHALGLAGRGARVVVNDLGVKTDGSGGSTSAADRVVGEIAALGGEAMASTASVTDFAAVEAMVREANERWGRVDILINNAGTLRDKTFAKMELDDFRAVLDVHLMGAVNCCKAVWETMRARNYGRIVMTTSSSGLYGNFGQANYGAAKIALVGLMNVLHQEGAKYDIRINTISPTAATRMTAELMPKAMLDLMQPESVTPAVLYLVSDEAPSRVILGAGAGSYARVTIEETAGVYLSEDQRTPEAIQARFTEISAPEGARALENAFQQTDKYVHQAAAAKGIDLTAKP